MQMSTTQPLSLCREPASARFKESSISTYFPTLMHGMLQTKSKLLKFPNRRRIFKFELPISLEQVRFGVQSRWVLRIALHQVVLLGVFHLDDWIPISKQSIEIFIMQN